IVDNTNGNIRAFGDINVRDASFTGNNNLTMIGGAWTAKSYNLFSGDGSVNFSADCIKGIVNASGGSAEVINNSGALNLGVMNLSGDPTFYNTGGDIVLNGDLSFPAQDLAIIASGNIINNTCQVITTGSLNNGGQITMIAGASITVSGGPTSANDNTTATVTVVGPSSTGGKINLSAPAITTLSS